MSSDTSPEKAAGIVNAAKEVLRIEAGALTALEDRIGSTFVEAVCLLKECSGRVIVSGIGKSGIIGRKIAATLTSTGTPAVFLHPVEGLHGDMGLIGRDDVAILISKSGGTEELSGLVDFLKRVGVPIIALTGDTQTPLSRHAHVVLDCSVAEEACPMDLAPTSSTTATLAMGDALAVVLLKERDFQEEDFARLHPGGALGRKLSVRVEDVMIAETLPVVSNTALMKDCIVPMAELRGTVAVVNSDMLVLGVVTAGDLTRLMERDPSFLEKPVVEVMTKSPKVIEAGELGSAAVHIMETHGIMALPVVNGAGHLKGMVHLHDLMRSGAV